MNILVINPGGSSTKIAIFKTAAQLWNKAEPRPEILAIQKILELNLTHSARILNQFSHVFDQLAYRKKSILENIKNYQFDVIATRGGPLKPLRSGTYHITKKVVNDIKRGRFQSLHPSLLGPLIAYELAQARKIPAFFVDPESTDEFFPLARISGLPEIPRRSLSHYLSINAVVNKVAYQLGKKTNQCNFIITHLGSGITVAAKRKGKQIDANNANEDGPFSPQRTGSLPLQGVIEMCYSGRYSKQAMLNKIQRQGGLLAYLGTDDIPTVERRIANGDKKATLIYQAMIYQIAKEIGAMLIPLQGKVDAIIITGGMAQQKKIVAQFKKWLKFLAIPIVVITDQIEMEALAQGVLRVMYKLEKVKKYQ